MSSVRTAKLLLRLRCLALVSVAVALGVVACTHQQLTPEARLQQGAADMRATITRIVADPAHRDQLLERANSFERVLADYAVEFESFVGKLHQANRNYDTPPEQIKATFAQFEKVRQTSRAQALDLHFQMLALTSADEWKQIAKAEIQMLETIGAPPPGTQEKKRD